MYKFYKFYAPANKFCNKFYTKFNKFCVICNGLRPTPVPTRQDDRRARAQTHAHASVRAVTHTCTGSVAFWLT